MTQNNIFRNIAVASVFTVTAAAAMAAQTSVASAKNVLSCDSGDRRSVIECCESIVQRKGLPLWMKQTGRNCSSVVKCSASSQSFRASANFAPVRRCYVKLDTYEGTNDRKKQQSGSRQSSQKDNSTVK